MSINTVLVVINDLEKTKSILKKALHICKEQGADLQILYVYEAPLFSLPDYFRFKEVSEESVDVAKVEEHIVSTLVELGSKVKPLVYIRIDDTLSHIERLTKHDPHNTLLVLEYDETLSTKIVSHAKIPLLVVKQEQSDYKKIIVPVDLSETTKPTIMYAQKLFTSNKIVLLHEHRFLIDPPVTDVDFLSMPVDNSYDIALDETMEKSQKESFENLKKSMGLEGTFLEQYASLEDDLEQHIKQGGYELCVLGFDDRELFFEDSVTLTLLKRLNIDILVFKQGVLDV